MTTVAAEQDEIGLCEQFLIREAELLDRGAFSDWLSLLTTDVEYEVPVRVTQERSAGPGVSAHAWHMKENYGSLETRIKRLETEYAWAEDPPSRTRHFVTNIRVAAVSDDEYEVRSNLLLFRSRGDSPAYDIISAERQDVVRRTATGPKLARRRVLLDQTTLGTQNLAILL